jgi:DNA-binding FadR family transcriptional regulator
MAETIEQQRELASDYSDFEQERGYQLDVQFHRLIARSTRNSTVIRLMNELLRDLSSTANIAGMAGVPEWTVDIHERTLRAIQSGNMSLIDSVMDEHLARTEEMWERATGKSLVPGVPDFLRPVVDREIERADSANAV